MAQNFDEVVRTVRLYASTAPLFLVRDWINDAYKDLARLRNWAFLRGETSLNIAASRALSSVSAVLGSTSVTSVGLSVASDLGRQFAVGSFPIYTIVAIPDVNTWTLDRAFSGETNAAITTAKVFDAYATMPADFGSFRVVVDPYNRRWLPYWLTEDDLAVRDAARSSSDSGPRALVAASPSTLASTLGRIRYEYWPQATSQRSYPALYNRQADNLNETDTFGGVLADAADVLVAGALSKAAEWPGTPDVKNPYFNAQLAVKKSAEFAEKAQRLALKDDAHYGDDLMPVDWASWSYGGISFDTHALRATDATVADYIH